MSAQKKKKAAKAARPKPGQPKASPSLPPRDIVGRSDYDHHCHVDGCTGISFGIPVPREAVPKSITFVCVVCAAAFLAGADLALFARFRHALCHEEHPCPA